MHVAFVITRGDAVGGASIHVRDMARALISRGMRATVLVGGEGEVLREFEQHAVPYVRVPALSRAIHPWKDALALRQLVGNLMKLKPDIVSAHTAKAGLLGRVAARLTGIPVLYTPHGWAITDRISRNGGRVFSVAERMAAPLASSIVNVCEAERELARTHGIGPDSKLVVVHNGVFDVPGTLLADPALDPPHILMVARFEPPKDHAALLNSLAELRHLPWTVELVGGGPDEFEARRGVQQLQIADRVDFCGSSRNVAERMAASQIFVLTTRSEGFPRSILEAMRAGLPVVASDVGGIAESVLHGSTGLVIPRGDHRQLTDALATLIASRTLRQKYGRAGRSRYENHFTFQAMFDKTVTLYLEVLSRRVGRVPAPMEDS